jgi:ectoine hydroxylase-related dioxygenase (phytanoyl-CoA dioxygenase family)
MAVETPASGDLRAAFERDGILTFDPQISLRVIDRAVADVERPPGRRLPWSRRRPGSDEAIRVTDAWATSASVRQIALAPRVLEVLRVLFAAEPRPFQTLNFKLGTQQRPHSDSVHFNTEPPGMMCGVWVALEDVDMDCGPLVYYPGSHRLPFASPEEVGIEVAPGQEAVSGEDYGKRYEPYIEALIEREGLTPSYATLPKGQAVVWAANLLHGGSTVRVPGRTRRSQVTHYYFEGARLWTPLLSSPGRTAWREAPQID